MAFADEKYLLLLIDHVSLSKGLPLAGAMMGLCLGGPVGVLGKNIPYNFTL